MSLFGNLLQAVENGSVEKSLSSAVDTLETRLGKAVEKAEKVTANIEEQGRKLDGASEKPRS